MTELTQYGVKGSVTQREVRDRTAQSKASAVKIPINTASGSSLTAYTSLLRINSRPQHVVYVKMGG